MNTFVVCYGEVLWDVFPQRTQIGGAPLNVTYHLNQLGVRGQIISRVGDDEWGRSLLAQLKKLNVSIDLCQMDYEHNTSKVVANVDSGTGETEYKILSPVAWDFIEWEEGFQTTVNAADAMVFGSLAMRNPVARETLFKLLDHVRYRVFDVNLRDPYFSSALILKTLKKVDLLKLNHHELKIIAHWLGLTNMNDDDKVKIVQENFEIEEVLLTKGAEGASYYNGDQLYKVPAFPVSVVDTVGSGDAFLAAFLDEKFRNSMSAPLEKLKRSALLGAFVANNAGACPAYTLEDLEEFKRKNNFF